MRVPRFAHLLFSSFLVSCSLCFLGSCSAPVRIRPAAQGFVRNQLLSARLYHLLDGALTLPEDEADYCLAQFIKQWKQARMPTEGDVKSPENENGVHYRVKFVKKLPGAYGLDDFSALDSAFDFEVAGMPLYNHWGVGAPMVGASPNSESSEIERFYPPEIISRPVTALISEGMHRGKEQEVFIHLLNPHKSDEVSLDGRRVPLAVDYSVPWARYLARTGKLNQSLLMDMMSASPSRPPQLYLMEPYHPEKEPVIMIHGLLSNMLAWTKLTNELWADRSLSRRYQIWHFHYNPSAPVIYSAQILRSQLRELRQLVDPDGNDAAMKKMTIVGHSMGGLIGKALVVRPDENLWNRVFTKPLDQLQLEPADREQLREMFSWQTDPSVRRLIFFAVPHKGSAAADGVIGKVGSRLTSPPLSYQKFFKRIGQANPDAFTPEYVRLSQGKFNGVQYLSPRQPILRFMADQPIPKHIHVHSIIGNRHRKDALQKSTDGFVPYSSSHLEEAISELVVPTGHRSFNHHLAVGEILRILRE